MNIMLNFLYLVFGLGFIALMIYVLKMFITNYMDIITFMVKDHDVFTNKFYFVLAIVSLVSPFIAIFIFGFNTRVKFVCAASFPTCCYFLMKSMELEKFEKECKKSEEFGEEVRRQTDELLSRGTKNKKDESKHIKKKGSTKKLS